MNKSNLVPRSMRKFAKQAHDASDRFVIHAELRNQGLRNVDRISTWTTQEELLTLYRLASRCAENAVALEIGSYLGAATCYIGAGLARNAGRIICVDTWQNETMPDGLRDTYSEFKANTLALQARITTIRKRSDELAPGELPDRLDFVFLDGDHSYAATRHDFLLVAERIAPEGIIAFHDATAFQGVSRVIGEALTTGNWMLRGMVNNLAWISPRTWPETHRA